MCNPKADRFVTLYRHQMDFEKARKRRVYGRACIQKLTKSVRRDFHPLRRFSSVPTVNLSGIICFEKKTFQPGGPSAQTDKGSAQTNFTGFALFFVLDLVF